MERKEKFRELFKGIFVWGSDRDLIHPENTDTQYLKFLEEVGETAAAILSKDIPKIKDGFGDIAVTIVLYGYQKFNINPEKLASFISLSDTDFNHICHTTLFMANVHRFETHYGSDRYILRALASLNDFSQSEGYDLLECLELAYNEIKNRKGKTINGNFVKNSPEEILLAERENEATKSEEFNTGR